MKKPSMTQKILSLASKVLVVLVIMFCLGMGSFEVVTHYITGSFYDFKKAEENKKENGSETTEEEKVSSEDMENTLLFVESEDGMQEYIILNMLNTKTNALDILLFPENPQVQVGKDILKQLQKKLGETGNSVQFDDIRRAYGDERFDIISSIVEEIIGSKIDGWDHMSQKEAVNFLKMTNNVTLNLNEIVTYRDTKGVLHLLESGNTSVGAEEGFAYMTYADGMEAEESNRLQRASNYLTEFFDRLIASKKSSEIIEQLDSATNSSEGRNYEALQNAIKAAKSTDFITLRILQGSEVEDAYVIDNQKVQLQIATLMKQTASYASNSLGKDSDDESSVDDEGGNSRGLSIEIYNAAYVQGIAGEWQQYLENQGYTITLIDTYQQEGPISTTRIVTDKDGIGKDLLKYFSGAEMSVGNIDTGGNIRIYIGTDHTTVGGSDQ